MDLRWGVSEEAALDQQTMNICLIELERCQDVSPRPNFIILLGDRYGWMPLSPQIKAKEYDEICRVLPDADKRRLADWYRLDTNAVRPEYVLRARNGTVAAESEYDTWSATEASLHAILLGAVNRHQARAGLPSKHSRAILMKMPILPLNALSGIRNDCPHRMRCRGSIQRYTCGV